MDIVEWIVKEKGANINAKYCFSFRPTSISSLLLIFLFPRDKMGNSPLRVALESQNFLCAKLLLELGADPNIQVLPPPSSPPFPRSLPPSFPRSLPRIALSSYPLLLSCREEERKRRFMWSVRCSRRSSTRLVRRHPLLFLPFFFALSIPTPLALAPHTSQTREFIPTRYEEAKRFFRPETSTGRCTKLGIRSSFHVPPPFSSSFFPFLVLVLLLILFFSLLARDEPVPNAR